MSETKTSVRLSKAAKEFNVGISTIKEFLSKKGFEIESSPNTKLSPELYEIIQKEYSQEKSVKEESIKVSLEQSRHETISIDDKKSEETEELPEISIEDLKTTGKKEAEIDEPAPSKPKEPIEEKPSKSDEPAIEEKPEEKVSDKIDKDEIKKPKSKGRPKKETEKKAAAKETPAEEPVKEKKKAKKRDTEEKTDIETPEVKTTKEEVKKEKAKEEEVIASDKEKKEAEPSKTEKKEDKDEPVILGKLDLENMNLKTKPRRKTKKEKEEELKAKKEDTERKRKKKSKPKEKELSTEEDIKEEKEPLIDISEIEDFETIPEQDDKPIVPKIDIEIDFLETKVDRLTGPTILGKMDLPKPTKKTKKGEKKKPVASSDNEVRIDKQKKKRKRIKTAEAKTSGEIKVEKKPKSDKKAKLVKKRKHEDRVEVSDEEIQKQIKETLARLTPTGKSRQSKLRRQKREQIHQTLEKQRQQDEEKQKTLQVTEFVTVKELAGLMSVDVNEIIAACLSLGMFVSINQRLDAETLTIVAEEFGFEVEFVSIEVQESIKTDDSEPEDTEPRHPIVTVMGHVDHGKTSLLDYIRKSNVIAGEAGGITQHIGAYEVTLENGKKITFLDTPGHEAFTAMRARGAKVTDIAIIVIAADDQIMPQTKEAINHAQAAGVPIVFAINKIDKEGANPDKVKEQLANMNLLVEDWGGKYQSHDISAKLGLHVDELLEKVLLEAEMLDLKCNRNRKAEGTVIESSLDKGRGYVAKLLVQNGTLKISDIVIAGCHYGRVKAMYNERNQNIKKAGPCAPVLLLGLHGAPQAGDSFNVINDEKEAKAIANKRLQLQREIGMRTQKHITLDEIGRRIAIGDFKELNIIVKGDVDGSVEALADSLLKLSTDQAQVNVIHKSVGAVSETDVMLASASDAIIVAFQVRPTPGARKLADQEQIDIRIYSIIYQAIEEIKSALEGMLAPEIEENITSNVEVREIYKISKVGTVAGCMVLDGKITKNSKIRLIRDGIVVYTGVLGSLKRYKDDVKEVPSGYECGLNIENFNDIKVGDIVESYEEVEVKRKL